MKALEQVAASLQVGTRRSKPGRSGYLPVIEATPEREALLEAGALDLMSRAGQTGRSDVPPLSDSPADRSPIAKRAIGPLFEAMDSGNVDLVLLWARRAAELGFAAPYPFILSILELGGSRRRRLLPVLGERGRWIADLMGVDIRGVDEITPEEHRRQLEADWKTMDWKDRAAGVAALRSGLSEQDIDFLELALADRRKEVREEAADLLCRFPASPFAISVRQLAKPVLAMQRKLLAKQLSVEPADPDSLPKGIPRTPAQEGVGPKAMALYDLVRYTDPSMWEAETGLSPDQIVDAARHNEYGHALLKGWTDGLARRFQNQDWADALFKSLTASPYENLWEMLCPHVSERLFDETVRSVKPEHRAAIAALERQQPLSVAASRRFIDYARATGDYATMRLGPLLDVAALPFLQENWPEGHDYIRQQWLTQLDLRKRLFDSLEHP